MSSRVPERVHQPAEVRMGNDIARAMPWMPPEQAVLAVAAHLEGFWEPRMRVALRSRVDAVEEGIDPLLAEAARRL